MRISNPSDFAIGIAFLASGMGAAVVASGYPLLPGTIVGAGLFPFVTGIAMALFGGILALQAWMGSLEVETVQAIEDGAEPQAGTPLFSGFAIGIVVILVVAAVLIRPLGFIAAGILVSIATIRLSGGSWLSAFIFSPVATLILFYVFVYIFGVPLPRGIIG